MFSHDGNDGGGDRRLLPGLTKKEDVGNPAELLQQVLGEEGQDVVFARQHLIRLEDVSKLLATSGRGSGGCFRLLG